MDFNTLLKFAATAMCYGRYAVANDGHGNNTTLSDLARDILKGAGLDPDNLPDDMVPEGMDLPQVSFLCTNVVKERERDDPEQRAIGGWEEIYDQSDDTNASTLTEIFAKLGKGYGIEIENVSIPVDHNDRNVTKVEFYRSETAGGDPMTDEDIERWKRREIDMYYTRYLFTIAKVATISTTEIEAAGINVDD